MATINEIKEQMTVVKSVGEFTNALQQIATLRMMKLRNKVVESRPFVEAAHEVLSELILQQNLAAIPDLVNKKGKPIALTPKEQEVRTHLSTRNAVIIVTSNQGLTGHYNIEIMQRAEAMFKEQPDAEYFVIGKKGQEAFANRKYPVQSFPYSVPDNFGIEDLLRLIKLFDFYGHITLIYSRYINTATHEVVTISVVDPIPEVVTVDEKPVKYIFEPDLETIISEASRTLRAALFQQQILDARLAQNSSQMLGMKTASDNATALLGDLRIDYNKQRRKMIDKKIGEVFAGSALW